MRKCSVATVRVGPAFTLPPALEPAIPLSKSNFIPKGGSDEFPPVSANSKARGWTIPEATPLKLLRALCASVVNSSHHVPQSTERRD